MTDHGQDGRVGARLKAGLSRHLPPFMHASSRRFLWSKFSVCPTPTHAHASFLVLADPLSALFTSGFLLSFFVCPPFMSGSTPMSLRGRPHYLAPSIPDRFQTLLRVLPQAATPLFLPASLSFLVPLSVFVALQGHHQQSTSPEERDRAAAHSKPGLLLYTGQ